MVILGNLDATTKIQSCFQRVVGNLLIHSMDMYSQGTPQLSKVVVRINTYRNFVVEYHKKMIEIKYASVQ
jgi:hypothetical protein